MVKNKRMAGMVIIVLGLVLGLMAFILDLITTGKIKFGQTPLYLLLGGLMISLLGAVYIGAGTNEANRLLTKQVKLMKGELSEKDKTIADQKKNLESLSDQRLVNLSPTVDRLDIMKKEEAEAEKKAAAEAPPKPAWEKKQDKPAEAPKPAEKPSDLPPPPPKSMVAPAPAKPAAQPVLPLPPPPPKSMQVQPKPVEHPVPKPVEHPVPKPAVAPAPVVEKPKPAEVPNVVEQLMAAQTAQAAPTPKPQPKDEHIEDSKDEFDEDELLPSTTCPKCGNTFRGDWDNCPFCDYNLKAAPPKAEAPKPEPAPSSGGLSILGYTPKKETPKAEAPPSPPIAPVITPPPTMSKPPEAAIPIRPAVVTIDKCPSCGKVVKSHWRNCPYCKAVLKE